MEHESFLEPLFEKAEAYCKTSYQLFILKTNKKIVENLSILVSRGMAILAIFIFIIFASIGISLWLGDLLGSMYFGFFCVSGFYGLMGVILYYFMHDWIKIQIGNLIIKHFLN